MESPGIEKVTESTAVALPERLWAVACPDAPYQHQLNRHE